uniref:Uncharacterized protein n=1 Tax=Anguilla anguilla TaxID=7936 RepID=A0A0E9W495_ANGAN
MTTYSKQYHTKRKLFFNNSLSNYCLNKCLFNQAVTSSK